MPPAARQLQIVAPEQKKLRPADVGASADFLLSMQEGGAAAVVGLPRTGKGWIVKVASQRMPRLVVFDPYGSRDRLESERGHEMFPWDGDLWSLRELLDHPDALDCSPMRIIVDPHLPRKKLGQAFSALATLCAKTGGPPGDPIWLVAEEASLYSRESTEAFLELTSGSAHHGVKPIIISQSIGMVTLYAMRHVTHIIALNQSADADFENLRKHCNSPSNDFAAAVAAWKPGDRPLHWRLGA